MANKQYPLNIGEQLQQHPLEVRAMKCRRCGGISRGTRCNHARCPSFLQDSEGKYTFKPNPELGRITGDDEPLWWIRWDGGADLVVMEDLVEGPKQMAEPVRNQMSSMDVGDKIDVAVSGWVGVVERIQ